MKIFNISICKSGTTSLEYLLKKYLSKNLFPYMKFYKNNNLVKNFFFFKNFKILDNLIDKYNFFSDIPFNTKDYYKYLDKKYKNSKFILIIRDTKEWIESYDKWLYNLEKIYNKVHLVSKGYWQINFNNNILNYKILNKKKVMEIYEKYNNDVINYFKNKKNFLVLYLKDDNNIQKINNFLKCYINLDKFPKKLCNNK